MKLHSRPPAVKPPSILGIMLAELTMWIAQRPLQDIDPTVRERLLAQLKLINHMHSLEEGDTP